MECSICKETKDAYKCDGCNTHICKNCGKLTSSEVKVLQLANRSMKFFCQKCRRGDSFALFGKILESKDQLIQSKDEIIRILKEELQDWRSNKTHFEEVNPTKCDENSDKLEQERDNVIIVNPTKTGKIITKQDFIEKNVLPNEIKVEVAEYKKSKNGGAIIKCATKEDVDKIKKDIEAKMGAEVVTKVPQLKKPNLKIVGIDPEIADKEKIIDCLWNQNNLRGNKEEIEVVVLKKMKTKYMAILQCSPIIHESLVKAKMVFMGWSSVRVFDFVRVLRCFKCGGYNHFADKCKVGNICLKCGGVDHKSNECNVERSKCRNCLESNKNLETNFDTEHGIFDLNCPTYLKNVVNQKKWVNYKIK